MAGGDFHDVQLTAAGVMAGQVRVSGAHIDYLFVPGERVRVLTSEWRKILSRQAIDGELLLEICEAAGAESLTDGSAKEQILTESLKGGE